MYIVIDNSKDNETVFYYTVSGSWIHKLFSTPTAGDLLKSLSQLLSENNLKPHDIEGLAVVVGKGRFTSTRVAVTVVNTFGYALKIPVVGIDDFDNQSVDDLFSDRLPGVYISPRYSSEPKIGKKKEV